MNDNTEQKNNARAVQHRRGTAAQNDAFTGLPGEITVDLDNKTIRVHDGETAGGTMLAKKSDINAIRFVPDYDSGINITGLGTANTSINIPCDGFIVITYKYTNGGESFFIDDRPVFGTFVVSGIAEYMNPSAPIPIAGGTHTMRTSYNASRIYSVIFYKSL